MVSRRMKVISSPSELADGGAYDYLIKMVDDDPAYLQSLLKTAELLIQDAEEGEYVTVFIDMLHIY